MNFTNESLSQKIVNDWLTDWLIDWLIHLMYYTLHTPQHLFHLHPEWIYTIQNERYLSNKSPNPKPIRIVIQTFSISPSHTNPSRATHTLHNQYETHETLTHIVCGKQYSKRFSNDISHRVNDKIIILQNKYIDNFLPLNVVNWLMKMNNFAKAYGGGFYIFFHHMSRPT